MSAFQIVVQFKIVSSTFNIKELSASSGDLVENWQLVKNGLIIFITTTQMMTAKASIISGDYFYSTHETKLLLRFTPTSLVNLMIGGLVVRWMLSLTTLRFRTALAQNFFSFARSCHFSLSILLKMLLSKTSNSCEAKK